MKTPRTCLTLPETKKKDAKIVSEKKGYETFSAYIRNLINKDVLHTKQQYPEWFALQ
jgi:hypothetical protein